MPDGESRLPDGTGPAGAWNPRVCLKKIVFRKGFRFIGQVKWPQAGAGTSGGMVVWTKDRFENAGRFFP